MAGWVWLAGDWEHPAITQNINAKQKSNIFCFIGYSIQPLNDDSSHNINGHIVILQIVLLRKLFPFQHLYATPFISELAAQLI